MATRRRNSWGTAKKLPSGKWRASFVGPDGVRYAAPKTYTAKVDALAWLARERVRAETEGPKWKPPGAVAEAGEKLADYADRWVDERRNKSGQPLRPRTAQLYRDLLRLHINPVLGDLEVSAISSAVIRSWHQGLTTGTTRKAHTYSLLHAILASAAADDVIESNPAKIRGAMSSSTERTVEPLTADELDALAAEMPEHLAVPILVMGWCGLRVGEMRGLLRSDVADDGSTIRVNKAASYRSGEWHCGAPKTKAGVRTVAVPPHIRAALVAVLPNSVHAVVFPSLIGGEFLGDWELRRPFKAAADKLGHKDLRIHDLRHTGATLAAQHGATTAELMRRIGHSTPSMALRYQHAADARDAELAQRLSTGR
ncbi:Phage integrase family protein [Rhodococcus sp. AW25M09]|uniref:tyrosine-type recombinase/integrase n=1 Tax=Rhodococcus sp. AW25M09 TaxID=1268303 RepID=UPI0002ABA02D|nr:site-specific integrase [Rhodococcus sp. AW25M09]CCQ15928.1 Phage integrase family protein [Rhodococcus sp. AW25M09]